MRVAVWGLKNTSHVTTSPSGQQAAVGPNRKARTWTGIIDTDGDNDDGGFCNKSVTHDRTSSRGCHREPVSQRGIASQTPCERPSLLRWAHAGIPSGRAAGERVAAILRRVCTKRIVGPKSGHKVWHAYTQGAHAGSIEADG